MKLLFFSPSARSSGQVLLGFSLASQLRAAGITSHFIIAKQSERLIQGRGFTYTLLDHSTGPFARILIEDTMHTFQPDAIVLADYLSYSYTMRRSFRMDPWFLDGYNLPVIPIDIWELSRTGLQADWCGRPARPISPRILDMEASLIPVPIAHPVQFGDDRAYPFRVELGERVTKRTRGHLFTTFGLAPHDRLVLVAMAPWQLPDNTADADRRRIAGRVPELLAHYLRQLPADVHFMMVGDTPQALAELPPERTHLLPSCSSARFEVLLGSADLVLSLNASAVTMARAVVSDIPAMLLTNGFQVPDTAGIDKVCARLGGISGHVRRWLADTVPLYPFRMWPLGYHAFMEPLLAGNPYADAISQAELLDEQGVVTGLEAALYDRATRDRFARARADYRQQLTSIPDTCETFELVAKRVGI